MTPGAGHGKDWKAVCRIIGAIPRATKMVSSEIAPRYKWEAKVGDKIVGQWMKKPHKIEKLIMTNNARVRGVPGVITLYKLENNKRIVWVQTNGG